MKKGLSYDEEMTLLLELTDSMDEGEYAPHFWFDTIMDIIEQEAAEDEEEEDED
mgnify:CR=1 FL=1